MASVREELILKIKGESFCKSNKLLGQSNELFGKPNGVASWNGL